VTARVYPRRKAGETVRSTSKPIVLTKEMLEPFFGTPLRTAAWHMGLCPTALKSVCRKLGINRWPYQQSRSSQRCPGDEASVGTEGEGESERTASASVSSAETVMGDQSNSSSPSGDVPEDPALLDDAGAHCTSVASSDAGHEDAGARAQDSQGPPSRGAAPKRLKKSNGDGPACLSSLMHHRTSLPSAYEACSRRFGQGAGSRLGEHYPPHPHPRMYYGYPGAYPMYSKPPHPFDMHQQRGLPYSHGTHMAAGAVCAARAESHQSRKHCPAASSPVLAADKAESAEKTLTAHHVQQACREGAEAEVGLSRAAQKLHDAEWAGLAQQISVHQAKWSSSSSSSVSDGWEEYDSSLCDMSWLCG
jgi:hypothetical protein